MNNNTSNEVNNIFNSENNCNEKTPLTLKNGDVLHSGDISCGDAILKNLTLTGGWELPEEMSNGPINMSVGLGWDAPNEDSSNILYFDDRNNDVNHNELIVTPPDISANSDNVIFYESTMSEDDNTTAYPKCIEFSEGEFIIVHLSDKQKETALCAILNISNDESGYRLDDSDLYKMLSDDNIDAIGFRNKETENLFIVDNKFTIPEYSNEIRVKLVLGEFNLEEINE